MKNVTWLMLTLTLSACGESNTWPTHEWPHRSPESQGVDSERLNAMLQAVHDEDLGLHSVTIVRHGAIVLDAVFFPYDRHRVHEIASATKSLTSTAVGLAKIDLDAPLVSFFPDRVVDSSDPRRQAITVQNALTMQSGFDCTADGPELTLLAMQETPDWIEYALNLPMASEPGTEWRYCSTGSHLLSGVVSEATGTSVDALLNERVFAPIGVTSVIWPRDPQGVTRGWGDARMSEEDMARIGYLFLHRGQWDGARLIDEEWIAEATRDHIEGPRQYGYQWWGAGDSYQAQGRGGQHILVDPARDMVIVATGAASPDQIQAQSAVLANEIDRAFHDGALPENAQATARLAATIASISRAPAPTAVPALPALAHSIAAHEYLTGDNLFGWRSFSLQFEDDEAVLGLTLASSTAAATIGLDGVMRVTRDVHFGDDNRHEDIDVALRGLWTNDHTFEVTFDTLDTIDAGTITFDFTDDSAVVEVDEKTYDFQLSIAAHR